MIRTLFALALVLALVSAAHAQAAQPSHVFHEAERRAQLHEQSIATTVLYVSTILLGTWGLIGGVDMIIDAGAAYCPRCDHTADTTVILGGAVAAGTALLLMFIAIGLNVDHASRTRALEREAGHAGLAPGPGDVGLALAWSWP